MEQLVIGMKCPKELRDKCNEVSLFTCKDCTTCKSKRFIICQHCSSIIQHLMKEEFKPVQESLKVMKEL